MNHVPFVKMSGAGNDFIVVANRDMPDVDPGWLASRVCTRAMSVGADGLIVIAPIDSGTVQVRFYNPDGSVAEMCGNGSRCAARYAYDNHMIDGLEYLLRTDSGELPVQLVDGDQFRVVMPEPAELELEFLEFEDDGLDLTVHAVRVGVPHCVTIVEDLDAIDGERLIRIGRSLRHHAQFPEGVNTNFVARQSDGTIRQRTYERGVENLTKACGTGATAIVRVLHALNEASPPVELIVDGGRLRIERQDERYWLSGDTRLIATGIISPEAVDWEAGTART